jgi:ParB family transcriptional regulator, chromosome partitioning protein
MSRLFTSSNYIMGVMEEVEIYKIKQPTYSIRSQGDDDGNDSYDLAKSITQKGLLHPIIIRLKGGYFEIVAGNRRYNACKKLGWRKVICHIIEATDKESYEISLIENVHKKTLGPIEEALAFKKYVDDYGWGGTSDLAKKIGKSVSYITKRIKLLGLSPDVLNSIMRGTIDTSVAEELFSIREESRQTELAQLISKRNLSLRQARVFIKNSGKQDSPRTYESSFFLMQEESQFEQAQRSFDKSIISLRIALIKLSEIIQNNENNWLIYEILMQHKNMLHAQIDLLIKQKKKI